MELHRQFPKREICTAVRFYQGKNKYRFDFDYDECAKWVKGRQNILHVLSYVIEGIAGMCSKTTVAPLDRIKILLQAHNKHYQHFGKSPV